MHRAQAAQAVWSVRAVRAVHRAGGCTGQGGCGGAASPAGEQWRCALVQELQRVCTGEVRLERRSWLPRGEARVAAQLEAGGLVDARVAGLLQLAALVSQVLVQRYLATVGHWLRHWLRLGLRLRHWLRHWLRLQHWLRAPGSGVRGAGCGCGRRLRVREGGGGGSGFGSRPRLKAGLR